MTTFTCRDLDMHFKWFLEDMETLYSAQMIYTTGEYDLIMKTKHPGILEWYSKHFVKS